NEFGHPNTLGGVLSQVQLKKMGPGVAKPGKSLTLSCTISRDSVTSTSATGAWFQQPMGKEPELVARILYRSSMIISQDTSKNQFSLQLCLLTAADTATYYCAKDIVTQSKAGEVDSDHLIVTI
uniref:Ig-like domain-containing protein n=1 Tax=Gopherus evgoodei TaxID=1825980 RepID=A0A8C4YUG3_9SAUR